MSVSRSAGCKALPSISSLPPECWSVVGEQVRLFSFSPLFPGLLEDWWSFLANPTKVIPDYWEGWGQESFVNSLLLCPTICSRRRELTIELRSDPPKRCKRLLGHVMHSGISLHLSCITFGDWSSRTIRRLLWFESLFLFQLDFATRETSKSWLPNSDLLGSAKTRMTLGWTGAMLHVSQKYWRKWRTFDPSGMLLPSVLRACFDWEFLDGLMKALLIHTVHRLS